MSVRRIIPCAIYTRKSSEEGLDQDYNSLDAQFDACSAYIMSQKQEGWKLTRGRYDDGGLSGGTLERPALNRLLHDIDNGLVKMVVVYKIDRLTRSLTDFAKLVDKMDSSECSFVSVTQAFNTSNSMGRLTLNVLLSFAQFEREVTAERIRDKIAASKKKGMWMGGFPPLGYDRHSDTEKRTLVVNEQEAKHVQMIFDLYAEHQCLGTVASKARELEIKSKRHAFAKGGGRGGNYMTRGQIHYLLHNPIYIGLIRHKKINWPGLHKAIVETAKWEEVNRLLKSAASKPRATKQVDNVSPKRPGSIAILKGKLFDEDGDRLTPTHSIKNGKKYRYYVSTGILTGRIPSKDKGRRIAAQRLENAILSAVRNHLLKCCERHCLTNNQPIDCLNTIASKGKILAGLVTSGRCNGIIDRVILGLTNVTISLNCSVLAKHLEINVSDISSDVLELSCPVTLQRRGVETKIIVGQNTRLPDAKLITALARSHGWLYQIKQGSRIAEIANEGKHGESYVRTRLQLAFLSPKIQSAIVEGRQPASLTLEKIVRSGVPLDWVEQAERFGF